MVVVNDTWARSSRLQRFSSGADHADSCIDHRIPRTCRFYRILTPLILLSGGIGPDVGPKVLHRRR
ncbi:MAG: hypothetical protein JO020_30955 [Chloroflexi bacterium]|nr:hypothetical protein [Chloroflexota bacterium]